MKSLYEKILARLATVTAIKFSDLDKGQMEYYELRPKVSFPAALVSLSLPRTEDLTMPGDKQKVNALFTIRLCFDFSGDTSSGTSAGALAASLAYFDVAEAVTAAFQGWNDADINRIKREAVRDEKRADNYKVLAITFSTQYEERF